MKIHNGYDEYHNFSISSIIRLRKRGGTIMKEKNWSVALEHDEYENDLELVVRDAIEAVAETAKGYYVNVVTPSNLGNPDDYLTAALVNYFKETITTKFIDQCGCGGYVLRVWKNK